MARDSGLQHYAECRKLTVCLIASGDNFGQDPNHQRFSRSETLTARALALNAALLKPRLGKRRTKGI